MIDVDEQQLFDLCKEAEEGKGTSLKKVLDNIGGLEERLNVLRKIDSLNEQRRKADPTLPDLYIHISPPIRGLNQVETSFFRRTPGFWTGTTKLVYGEVVEISPGATKRSSWHHKR